jgi:hypothetical protein
MLHSDQREKERGAAQALQQQQGVPDAALGSSFGSSIAWPCRMLMFGCEE